MATIVQLSGNPGTGKTRSLKNLSPKETYIIDGDKKGLPWKGWKLDFNTESKNYLATSDPKIIYQVMKGISDTRPEIKQICLIGINSIMSDKEMAEAKKPGFDKWMNLALDIYELYTLAGDLREDLFIITEMHIEPYDVDGETHWRGKYNGQKLTKLNMNGKLNYNLYTYVEHDELNGNSYYFVTQSNGKTEARSPEGVLPYKMNNDMAEVIQLIKESGS